MGSIRHWAFVFFILFWLGGWTRLQAQDAPPYADFGATFLREHGEAGAASDLPYERYLREYCISMELGLLQLRYPRAFLEKKEHCENLLRIALAALDWQRLWIQWLGQGSPGATTALADLEKLRAWIASWKPASLSKQAQTTETNLLTAMAASADVAQAAARLNSAMIQGETLGLGPQSKQSVVVLLLPTRLYFVQMLGYAGLLQAEMQASLWTGDAAGWTSFWIGNDFMLALEYPPWEYDPSFRTGLSMDKFEKTGLIEHTLQQIGNTVLWACYGENDALYLKQALAMDLVIEVCGQINALEGDAGRGTTGGRTNPYEKFVPGGNSSGGVLPPIPAATQDTMKTGRWRTGLGQDRFLTPLKKGQKEGLKLLGKEKPESMEESLARDKTAHFMLVADDGVRKHLIHAPFFGSKAKERVYPPADVLLDYREFFRAYKCSFFSWLRTYGDEAGAENSAKKFAELLKGLHARSQDQSFEAYIEQIYGRPLSAANGETESLEWDFLQWLDRSK